MKLNMKFKATSKRKKKNKSKSLRFSNCCKMDSYDNPGGCHLLIQETRNTVSQVYCQTGSYDLFNAVGVECWMLNASQTHEF